MLLPRFELCVYPGRVIQDLNFLSLIGSVTLQRCVYTQSVVGTGRELKLETENKIAILLFGAQISVTTGTRINRNRIVFNNIVGLITYPVVQIFTVKQRLIPFCFLLR